MLDTEEKYGGSRHTKSYPKRKLLLEFDDEAIEPIQPKTADKPDQPPRGRDKAATQAEQQPAPPPIKIEMEEFGVTRTTSGRPWTVEQDIQDRSTDREDVLEARRRLPIRT